jgi:hypothetical protein
MLCSVCKNFSSSLPVGYLYEVENLVKQDREKGCDICALFWRALQALLGDDAPKFYHHLYFDNPSRNEFGGPVRGRLSPYIVAGVRNIRLQFYLDSQEGKIPEIFRDVSWIHHLTGYYRGFSSMESIWLRHSSFEDRNL